MKVCLLSVCCFLPLSLPVRSGEILTPRGEKSIWQYLDAGQEADKAWATPAFDASKWKAGPAPLGYGEKDMATTVSFGADAKAKPITTYFRRTINIADPATIENVIIDLRRDDGAIVYWNGKEIARSNMPEGPVNAATPAADTLPDSMEKAFYRFVKPAKGLVTKGPNVIAAEVHQCDPGSSDLIFDLEAAAYAPGEALPQMDYFAEAIAALRSKNLDRAYEEILKIDPARQGYSGFITGVWKAFAPQRNSLPDERYFKLLDKAFDAAPGEMEVAYAWVRARVDARRDLPVKPVRRPVPAAVPEEFRFIADTPPGEPGDKLIPRDKLLADVDDLELILENCYAYLERRGANYRGALDALRASLTGPTPLATFQHRVSRMLTVFGDPHSAVRTRREAGSLFQGMFVMDGEKLAALSPGHASLYLDGFPVVAEINGRPASEWIKAAEHIVPQSSPQFRRRTALEELIDLPTVARELGVPGATFSAVFQSADGKDRKTVNLRVSKPDGPPDREGVWPQTESQIRKEGVGYLRLSSMRQDPPFVSSLNDWMKKFKDTRGLIIDVRGNGGGTQDAVQTLLPWFMKPGSPLKVINVAAYRLPLPLPKPNPSGFLGLFGRGLHPVTSRVWTKPQVAELNAFLKTWEPKWKLPEGKFTKWHFMALSHESNPAAGYYDKPVIVLMDAGCFSATDNFLGAFKGHPNVTLMGTASGGGSGRMAGYTLPNSGTQLTLCQMASFAATGQTYDGIGVLPDVVMEAKLEDQIDGRGDSVLEAAVAKLK
jgi:C-terminal processing protease CtpA/Prc